MYLKERKYPKGHKLTEGQVRELIDDAIRVGLSPQARELESHLRSLHERVQALEATTRR
jgi:hypothetical protein